MMVNDVEIVWLKHAGFKITGAGMTIYIDPYGVRAGEPADLILITHDHFDHCDLPSLRALAGKDTVIL
ncbi:MAG TPA: hypothetical protein EYP10_12660, partial [Armatimonadetes bacterium]|nr:hypothetical protein [Armatimonadota bacterium]